MRLAKSRDVAGIPASRKNKAYWVIAGLSGTLAGGIAWYVLTQTDPIGKLKVAKDHPSTLRRVI